jgi:UDP-N-acetylmuramoyl-tripeptide--D-alanyl-D-alanine ligase
MGSLAGIAETKGAIYEALPDDGVAVVNVDDAFAGYFMERIGARATLRFGLDNAADVRAAGLRLSAESSAFELLTPAGRAEIMLAFAGRHNVLNALAATAMALAAGAPFEAVVAGLQDAVPVAGRQLPRTLDNGAVLIDDSYNANPGSVAAAITVLAEACASDGRSALLVLGDMAELGGNAEALHAEIGRQAKAGGVAQLWTCGKLSHSAHAAFGAGARHFEDRGALAAALRDTLTADQRVLVKGSRSSGMDAVVNALLEHFALKEIPHAS